VAAHRADVRADRPGSFWAFAWAGGLALARYLLDHPETVRGRHAIDIASGSGLVAIGAAKAGAAAVAAYGIAPVAAVAIRMNAAANGVTVLPVCADILNQDNNLPACAADLVLVADAFYQRDLAGTVMRLAERGHARGAAVLVGDFGRAYLPRDRLTPLASYDVPGQRMLKAATSSALPSEHSSDNRQQLRAQTGRSGAISTTSQ
jgi:predicted nicotinamide N-methyase